MELAGLLCILTCQKGNGRSVNVRWRELDGTHGLTQHVSGFAFPRDVTHAGIMRITFQSLRLTAELSALESNILGEIFFSAVTILHSCGLPNGAFMQHLPGLQALAKKCPPV